MNALADFVSSGAFALLALTLVLAWTAAMAALCLWPETFTPIASFAANFRIWCFGYDPATGKFDLPRLIMIAMDPIFLGAVIGGVWKHPLVEFVRSRPASILRYSFASVIMVTGILFWVSRSDAQAANGTKIADYALKRTYESAPKFDLKDQNGGPYSIRPGRVTVVSAFYSHCAHTCPKIIEQARAALQKAQQAGADIDMALITLDPERDTVPTLKERANALKLSPNWHLLTGEPKQVNEILDRYHVARTRDSFGNIGHSNIFYVIDRKGKLAFRVGLGTMQEVWLRQVIELLTREG